MDQGERGSTGRNRGERREEYFYEAWERGEELALKIGLDLDTYWNKIDPAQFEKYIKVYQEKAKEKAIEQDMQNYNLARYIAIGVNDPKKFPREPYLAKELKGEEDKVMTAIEMEKVAESMTYKLGGVIKDGKHKENT